MTGVKVVDGTEVPLPYTFWTAYGVEVSNLSPTDVLHLNAQAEVTLPFRFNVQVDGAFACGLVHGEHTFKLVGLATCGQNVTPNMHHMVVARQGDWIKWYCLLQLCFGGG
jgi:hypothetical protein